MNLLSSSALHEIFSMILLLWAVNDTPRVVTAQVVGPPGWSFAFQGAKGFFGPGPGGRQGGGQSRPADITISYTADAPDMGIDKYYKVEIMAPGCQKFVPTGAITPADDPSTGIIDSELSYDTTTNTLSVNLDVDTTAIESSETFYRPDPAGNPSKFVIAFCARVTLNSNGDPVTTQKDDISFYVDKIKSFGGHDDDDDDDIDSEVSSARTSVQMNHPINIYFCDDTNAAQPLGQVFKPGDMVQFCVNHGPVPTPEAMVDNLINVYFENTLDTTLNIPIIDSSSTAANYFSSINCFNGICNVKTRMPARMYEKFDEDRSEFVDISSGPVRIVGTTVLSFSHESSSSSSSTAATRSSEYDSSRKHERPGYRGLLRRGEQPDHEEVVDPGSATSEETEGRLLQWQSGKAFNLELSLATPPPRDDWASSATTPSVTGAFKAMMRVGLAGFLLATLC